MDRYRKVAFLLWRNEKLAGYMMVSELDGLIGNAGAGCFKMVLFIFLLFIYLCFLCCFCFFFFDWLMKW